MDEKNKKRANLTKTKQTRKPKAEAVKETAESVAEQLRAKQKEQVLEWLPKLRFHISKTCKKVGIHRTTLQYWLKTDEEFKKNYLAVQEEKMDDSEERLFLLSQGIPKIDQNGKLTGWEVRPHFGALVTLLKAQAKDRGYGDYIEIDDKREGDIDVANKTDKEIFAELKKIQERYSTYEPSGANSGKK